MTHENTSQQSSADWAAYRVTTWLCANPRYKGIAMDLAKNDLAEENALAEYVCTLVDDADGRLHGTDVGRSLTALRALITPRIPLREINWATVRGILRTT